MCVFLGPFSGIGTHLDAQDYILGQPAEALLRLLQFEHPKSSPGSATALNGPHLAESRSQAIKNHENSQNHKNNVKQYLDVKTQIKKDEDRKQRELDSELARIKKVLHDVIVSRWRQSDAALLVAGGGSGLRDGHGPYGPRRRQRRQAEAGARHC